MGLRLKKIAFIYLISYLSVTAVGFGLFPALTLKLFLSNGDYGVIMPRMLGAMMGVLDFLLFVVYRNGDTIVLVGLVTTAVGTVLQRRELLAWKSRALDQLRRHSTAWSTPSRTSYTCGGWAGVRSDENESTEVTGVTPEPLLSASVSA